MKHIHKRKIWGSFLYRLQQSVQFLFRLTGGRPMIDEGFNFTDTISGKSVRNYQDRLGRKWMADSGKWSIFRVERNCSHTNINNT